jgi:hypothetical protein
MTDAAALVLAELSVGDYAPIRSAYKMEIGGYILEYLLTEKVKVSKYKNGFKRAIREAFVSAFEQGFFDGGGELPYTGDDNAWLVAKQTAEDGYVDLLFQQLKELKTDPDLTTADFQAEADRRAEGYAKTLDGVYAEGKLRGGKDVMLTFGGDDGEESCKTCQRWKGKRHKASFWIKRGLIPHQPGNTNFDCGGYNCQHFLFTDKGEVWTL